MLGIDGLDAVVGYPVCGKDVVLDNVVLVPCGDFGVVDDRDARDMLLEDPHVFARGGLVLLRDRDGVPNRLYYVLNTSPFLQGVLDEGSNVVICDDLEDVNSIDIVKLYNKVRSGGLLDSMSSSIVESLQFLSNEEASFMISGVSNQQYDNAEISFKTAVLDMNIDHSLNLQPDLCIACTYKTIKQLDVTSGDYVC